MRKIFTLILALVATLSTLRAEIYSGTCGTNLNWSLNTEDSTLVITGSGAMTNWSGSYYVPWKNYGKKIKHVVFPEGLTSIGSYAFDTDYSIQGEIVIPNSVTTINKRAFAQLGKITSVTFGTGLKTIGEGAFYYCFDDYLNPIKERFSIVIPYGVTSIGKEAFYGCQQVESISIPNSVKSIGELAFAHYRYLSSITVPSSVTSIGNNAFVGAGNVIYSGSASGSPWGAKCRNGVVDGYLIYSDATKTTLCCCDSKAKGHIEIPNTVTNIGEKAFYYCDSLTSVSIPVGITNIEQYTFANCYSLTSVSLPEGLTTIGTYAFQYCRNLTSLEIPNSVSVIGGSAFFQCTNLSSVNIPAGLTKLSGGMFSGTAITSLVIPENITSIGQGAFSNCTQLTELVIPNTIADIGLSAFSGCSSLTSLNIPEGSMDTISATFKNCSSLTSLELPSSVILVGYQSFYNCTGLVSLTCKATTPPVVNSSDAFTGVDKSIPLFVPAESMELYQVATGWSEFTNIKPIGNPAKVTFLDWDGSKIAISWTTRGEAATPPADPSREGYHFIGWDHDLSNVTEDMTVTALYEINRYRVQFIDWNGEILKTDSVDWSSAATAPGNPAREGYTFVGWGSDFSSVKADLYVIAQYERELTGITVSYVDEDNAEIESEIINFTLPLKPLHPGRKFVAWQVLPASDINDGITIRATYEEDEITVQPATTTATFFWSFVTGGFTYTLSIYTDASLTTLFCTITFNQSGVLIGINYANRAPRRMVQQEEGFTYTVSDLDANTVYYYKMVTRDEDEVAIGLDEGAFQTKATDTPTDVQSTEANHQTPIKVIRDNSVLILRGNQIHTVTGQQVK